MDYQMSIMFGLDWQQYECKRMLMLFRINQVENMVNSPDYKKTPKPTTANPFKTSY